jgi:hypothetical protein
MKYSTWVTVCQVITVSLVFAERWRDVRTYNARERARCIVPLREADRPVVRGGEQSQNRTLKNEGCGTGSREGTMYRAPTGSRPTCGARRRAKSKTAPLKTKGAAPGEWRELGLGDKRLVRKERDVSIDRDRAEVQPRSLRSAGRRSRARAWEITARSGRDDRSG